MVANKSGKMFLSNSTLVGFESLNGFFDMHGFWTAVVVTLLLGVLCSFFFQRSDSAFWVRVRYVVGFILSIDFLLFWLVPIAAQGAFFKLVLMPFVCPLFDRFDRSPVLRSFAAKYIYRNPRHADFFMTQLMFLVNFGFHLALALYWQLEYGKLSWGVIAVYNFGWVGIGGRAMGALYSIAHKEGHNTMIYKSWIRNTLGNVFENWVGLFYGSVPYNFTTSHISLHHRVDGGVGDTLYAWDFERCSFTDFVTYSSRGLVHMSGLGGLWVFWHSPRKIDSVRNFNKLLFGVTWYWVMFPAVLFYFIPSASFYFWIIIQPLLCMSLFITLLNGGYHAFIETEKIPCVESANLLASLDDYFGENDHMAHHTNPEIYYRDLPEFHHTQQKLWAKHNATVFQGVDPLSYSFFVLLKAWPILAERYVDFSGKLSKKEIEVMLETRSKRIEMEHTRLMPLLDKTFLKKDRPVKTLQRESGGRMYEWFMSHSKKWQLLVAGKINEGMPPIQSVKLMKEL
mmetsp:Transcript_16819/g.27256  ORF Transcript_16819/g.27256 Transcript_16819/m.27256 type:complete len:511 (+) Transcript_16819:1045-2577(+)